MITGIGHTAYCVRNMKDSLAFYCDLLGLTHAFSIDGPDGKPWIEYLKVTGGQFVELFYPGEDYQPREGGSYRHLCLLVDNMAETVAELGDRGATIRSEPKQGRDGNWQCWLDDPDGNAIELMQIHPDSRQAQA